jgi:hypothetical protein
MNWKISLFNNKTGAAEPGINAGNIFVFCAAITFSSRKLILCFFAITRCLPARMQAEDILTAN